MDQSSIKLGNKQTKRNKTHKIENIHLSFLENK